MPIDYNGYIARNIGTLLIAQIPVVSTAPEPPPAVPGQFYFTTSNQPTFETNITISPGLNISVELVSLGYDIILEFYDSGDNLLESPITIADSAGAFVSTAPNDTSYLIFTQVPIPVNIGNNPTGIKVFTLSYRFYNPFSYSVRLKGGTISTRTLAAGAYTTLTGFTDYETEVNYIFDSGTQRGTTRSGTFIDVSADMDFNINIGSPIEDAIIRVYNISNTVIDTYTGFVNGLKRFTVQAGGVKFQVEPIAYYVFSSESQTGTTDSDSFINVYEGMSLSIEITWTTGNNASVTIYDINDNDLLTGTAAGNGQAPTKFTVPTGGVKFQITPI